MAPQAMQMDRFVGMSGEDSEQRPHVICHCRDPNKADLAHIWKICDQKAVLQMRNIRKFLKNMKGSHVHLLHPNTYLICMRSMEWHVCVRDGSWTDRELRAPPSRDAHPHHVLNLIFTIDSSMLEYTIGCVSSRCVKLVTGQGNGIYECQIDVITSRVIYELLSHICKVTKIMQEERQ